MVAKPLTYMNLSGDAVRLLVERVSRIHRTISSSSTTTSISPSASSASARTAPPARTTACAPSSQILETERIPRLRVGIGAIRRPGRLRDYVLDEFWADEQPVVGRRDRTRGRRARAVRARRSQARDEPVQSRRVNGAPASRRLDRRRPAPAPGGGGTPPGQPPRTAALHHFTYPSITALRSSAGGSRPWARMKSWYAGGRSFVPSCARRRCAAPSAAGSRRSTTAPGPASGTCSAPLPARHGVREHDLVARARGRPPRGVMRAAAAGSGSRKARAARMQAELQRDELAVERHERLHLGLGVQRPALDVDAVEGEHRARRARRRFSTIDANCSSWPGRASCAVSVQDAASKVKSSKSMSPLPLVVGHAQRQHELALLAGVADQPRRLACAAPVLARSRRRWPGGCASGAAGRVTSCSRR